MMPWHVTNQAMFLVALLSRATWIITYDQLNMSAVDSSERRLPRRPKAQELHSLCPTVQEAALILPCKCIILVLDIDLYNEVLVLSPKKEG